MNITEILTVILLIAASVLCIALIYFVYKIVKSVRSISVDITELSSEVKPLVRSALEFLQKLTRITNEAESQLQISRSIIIDIRKRADTILDTEIKIRNGIKDSVIFLSKNYYALGKGIESFRRTYRNK